MAVERWADNGGAGVLPGHLARDFVAGSVGSHRVAPQPPLEYDSEGQT